jgi:hypothetical protein
MNCKEVHKKLNEYIDGELSAAGEDALRAHIDDCTECAAEAAALRALRGTAAELARGMEPDEDLWPAIERTITSDGTPARKRGRVRRLVPPTWTMTGVAWRAAVLAAAAIAVVLGAREWRARTGAESPGTTWEVTRLEGSPVLGKMDITARTTLGRGEWLRTDANSRARLTGSDIGRVDVGPASAVRLVRAGEKEHRIELAEGQLSAFIWAPPRLFFVETPSGVAEDLGCQYDLIVDRRGNGTLDVSLGFVSFERDGREVIVPSGARCALRAGVGPGTPHAVSAAPELREALARFDFDGARTADLTAVLDAVTETDAVTLWHLIPRASGSDRARVVDRLAGLVALPDGVVRESVLALDRPALEAWWTAIYPSWDVWN